MKLSIISWLTAPVNEEKEPRWRVALYTPLADLLAWLIKPFFLRGGW